MSIRSILVLLGCSALAAATIFFSGFHVDISQDEAQKLGQTLTMILLAFGLIANFQAAKGALHPAPLIILAAIPPGYAYLNGPPQQIVGYTVLICGIFLFVIYKIKHLQAGSPRPDLKGSAQPNKPAKQEKDSSDS